MESTQLVKWGEPTQMAEIKKLYAKDLTDEEFQIFVGIGQSTGLNPFLREIWAVKYGGKAASIFIGRDGYRKAAQANPEYDYHTSDAVYSKDTFKVRNGEIEHDYAQGDRGNLVGAYSVVKRRSATKAIYVYVQFVEYYQGHKDSSGKIKNTSYGKPMGPTLWDTKPATMIAKVAEAQALRMAFQEIFAGTYSEAEDWMKTPENKNDNKQNNAGEDDLIDLTPVKELVDGLKSREEYQAKKTDIEAALLAYSNGEPRRQAKTYVMEKFKKLPQKTQVEQVQAVFEGSKVVEGEVVDTDQRDENGNKIQVDSKTGEVIDQKTRKNAVRKADENN